jgi:Universal stress protein family
MPPGFLIDLQITPVKTQGARPLEAAYIVLGSHGHTALYELIVGGTAAGILRDASCPVLIIPPPSRPKSGVGKPAARRRAVSVRL